MKADKFQLLKKILEDYKLYYNYEKLISETKEFSSPAILLNNTASLISRLDNSLEQFQKDERLNVLNHIFPTMVNYGDKEKISPLTLAVKDYFDLQISILNKDFKAGDKIVDFENKMSKIFADLDILKNNIQLKILKYNDALNDLQTRGIKEDVGAELIKRMSDLIKNLSLAQEKVNLSTNDFVKIKSDLNEYQDNIDKLKKLNYKINLQIYKPDVKTINEQNQLLNSIKNFEDSLRNKSFKIQSAINQFFDKNLIEQTNLLLQKTSNGLDVLEGSRELSKESFMIKQMSEQIQKEKSKDFVKEFSSLNIENEIKKELLQLVPGLFANTLNLSNELEKETQKVRTEANKKIVEAISFGFI